MRSITSAVCISVAIGLLTGCSTSNLGAGSSVPTAGSQSNVRALKYPALSLVQAYMQPAGVNRLRLNSQLRMRPATSTAGIYASNFYANTVWGFPNPNQSNGPASCTLGGATNYLDDVNGFGADPKGNVMIPGYTPNDSGYLSINVFGPNCGALIWQAAINFAQPADAWSADAANKNVLVGLLDIYTAGKGGAVMCSQSSGCGTPFTNTSITGYVAGVAMNKKGDCWLFGETSGSDSPVLVYFKKCKGAGQVATGIKNTKYGGIFVDTKGQLGAIDRTGTLYVYKKCSPACKLVSTSTLEGESLFAGLDAKGKNLAVGDYQTNTVDIYTYSPKTGAKYSYSFNNGLTGGSNNLVETAVFSPSNKKV